MADLFNSKELTRKEKMSKSRKITTDLTRDAINYINDTKQFIVHRQNNIPSTRLAKEIDAAEPLNKDGEAITVYDIDGKPVEIFTEQLKTYYKKNQKEFALLDIAGFRISDGVHLEIEVKTGKDKLKQDQKDRIKSIRDTGGISFAFSDMKMLKILIEPYLQQYKPAF